MAIIPTIEELKRLDTSHDLILSLTLSEEIIQFNKESERFTGFSRDEVLHKKLSEVLIPKESATLWKNLLHSIQQDLWIDNFVLPIRTKDDHVHMITWTGFLVKDEHGAIKDICIFGKPLETETIEKSEVMSPEPVHRQEEPAVLPEIAVISPPVVSDALPQRYKQHVPIKHGVNRIMFAREKKLPEEQTYPVEEKTSKTLVAPVEKPIDAPSQKLESIHDSLSDLLQKYEIVSKRVAELEKKDQQTEKKQEYQETAPPPDTEEPSQSTKKQKDVDPDPLDTKEHETEEEKPTFLSDPLGFKRQHAEINLKKQQIELRSKELEAFEARLLRQESTLNARVDEFSRWQEKLMHLESAIEKRRQELMKQENFVLGKGTLPAMTSGTTLPESEDQKATPTEMPSSNDDTLEKIPQSAAIIQRGILKQINTPFLELLGYSIEEIIEKSYFDFISLEGLADVEKYYMDRLKGDSVSVYRTVFSTKNDTKIPVEVSIKQTIYKGEKAEIAIITCLNSTSV